MEEAEHKVELGDFIICSATAEEAFKLEEECNITSLSIIHILTDEIGEPSLFQKMSGPSETSKEELNEIDKLSRILIGPTNDTVIEEASRQGWSSNVWSGIVISDVESVVEYRKVYPVYTA